MFQTHTNQQTILIVYECGSKYESYISTYNSSIFGPCDYVTDTMLNKILFTLIKKFAKTNKS
jgi:hypothetical protein